MKKTKQLKKLQQSLNAIATHIHSVKAHRNNIEELVHTESADLFNVKRYLNHLQYLIHTATNDLDLIIDSICSKKNKHRALCTMDVIICPAESSDIQGNVSMCDIKHEFPKIQSIKGVISAECITTYSIGSCTIQVVCFNIDQEQVLMRINLWASNYNHKAIKLEGE